MIKRILVAIGAVGAMVLLSGCSISNPVGTTTANPMANATVLKSADNGASWQVKINIDGKKTIAGINVLAMEINPFDPNNIYLGTDSNGLFMTKDGGETWTAVAFPSKAYGLAFDAKNPDVIYASGVINGRAKLYKRIGQASEWKEIYTEPADGTVISSLAVDRVNTQILYAGTNDGVIIKSTDGGTSWVNLEKADGPITSIVFDSANGAHVFFAVFQIGVLETHNGGAKIEDITGQIDTAGRTSSVYTLTADPNLAGVVYVGTGAGIFKKAGSGWSELNVISSSKAFPIRAIAINPQNSKEIIYSSAKAIYKSIDSGARWATFQMDTSKDISVLRYDQSDPTKIYAGMRSF